MESVKSISYLCCTGTYDIKIQFFHDHDFEVGEQVLNVRIWWMSNHLTRKFELYIGVSEEWRISFEVHSERK